MTLFWLLSALLAAGALLLVLRPFLARRAAERVSRDAVNVAVYRDQLRELDADRQAGTLGAPEYERARRELEARLLEDVDAAGAAAPASGRRGIAHVLGAAIPLCALALYFAVGNPEALLPRPSGDAAHSITPQQIEALVERLAARLENEPGNAEGWVMLARSYRVLGRFAEAAEAYARAAQLLPGDAQLLADHADMLAMAQGGRLEGEPEKLIAQALEIDAKNLKALALAGSAAFEKKDYAGAARLWQRMLPLVPADSEDARAIQANVDEALALAGRGAAGKAATAGVAPRKGALRGVVRLSPELASRVAPSDTVFIFARAAEGPPAPLAVLRRQARELPIAFALDDSMAMAPGLALSKFPRVTVAARVSRAGSATPQPGDLQGTSAPVANDAASVAVLIDSVVR
jgi:cytochrome c-type biogenesis protein CcmH